MNYPNIMSSDTCDSNTGALPNQTMADIMHETGTSKDIC